MKSFDIFCTVCYLCCTPSFEAVSINPLPWSNMSLLFLLPPVSMVEATSLMSRCLKLEVSQRQGQDLRLTIELLGTGFGIFKHASKCQNYFKVKHWKICAYDKTSHGQHRFQLIWRFRTFAYLGYASPWNAMRLPSQLHGMKWREHARWTKKARKQWKTGHRRCLRQIKVATVLQLILFAHVLLGLFCTICYTMQLSCCVPLHCHTCNYEGQLRRKETTDSLVHSMLPGAGQCNMSHVCTLFQPVPLDPTTGCFGCSRGLEAHATFDLRPHGIFCRFQNLLLGPRGLIIRTLQMAQKIGWDRFCAVPHYVHLYVFFVMVYPLTLSLLYNDFDIRQCTLWTAPSTLPNAGSFRNSELWIKLEFSIL